MVEQDPRQAILEQLRSFEQSPSDLLAAGYEYDNLNRFIRPIKYKSRLPHGAKTATDGHFYAGGEVIDDAQHGIARVRLLSDSKLIGEDRVEDGLVLFVSDQNVQMPVQSEYYNQSGELVETHPVSLLL